MVNHRNANRMLNVILRKDQKYGFLQLLVSGKNNKPIYIYKTTTTTTKLHHGHWQCVMIFRLQRKGCQFQVGLIKLLTECYTQFRRVVMKCFRNTR